MDRRHFLLSTAALSATAIMTGIATCLAQGATEIVSEKQQGDPAVDPEILQFDPYKVQSLLGATKAEFRGRSNTFSKILIEHAQGFVGINRAQNKDQIGEFLEVFDLPFAMGNQPVPFCAAGLCNAAALAYLEFWGEQVNDSNRLAMIRGALEELDKYHFYPSPSVIDMYYVALGKRRWRGRQDVDPSNIQTGWLAVFDWNKSGGAKHVGIVTGVSGGKLDTIEFNTSDNNPGNGGRVAVKKRTLDSTVTGFIRTDLKTPL
jgi:hypothetical protein